MMYKILFVIFIIFVVGVVWGCSINEKGTIYTFGEFSVYISLIVSLGTCLAFFVIIANLYEKLVKKTSKKQRGQKNHIFKYLPLMYMVVFIIFLVIELNRDSIIQRSHLRYGDYKLIYSAMYLWLYVLLTWAYSWCLKRTEEDYNKNIFSKEIKTLNDILKHIDKPFAYSFTAFLLICMYFRIHPDDISIFPQDKDLHRFSYVAIGDQESIF